MTFFDAFVDEIEKMGGVQRLARISRSMIRAGKRGDVSKMGRLKKPLETAQGKVARRVMKDPAGYVQRSQQTAVSTYR